MDEEKFKKKKANRMATIRGSKKENKIEEKESALNQIGRIAKCDRTPKKQVCLGFTIGTPRGGEISNDVTSDTQTTKYYRIATPDKDEDDEEDNEDDVIVNVNKNSETSTSNAGRKGDHAGDPAQSKAAEL